MKPDKLFHYTIRYLQLSIAFGILMCVVLLFMKSFDPMGEKGLQGMIMSDFYIKPFPPDSAVPLFEFMFLLFDWLSVLSFAMLFLVVTFPLQKRERWAYWCLVLLGVFWPVGAAGIALHTGAHSYFVSVAVMTIMFFPPVVILKRYF